MTRRDKEVFDSLGLSTDDMPDPAIRRYQAEIEEGLLEEIEEAAVAQDEEIRKLTHAVRDTRWIANNWRAATVVLAIIEAVQVVRWWVR